MNMMMIKYMSMVRLAFSLDSQFGQRMGALDGINVRKDEVAVIYSTFEGSH